MLTGKQGIDGYRGVRQRYSLSPILYNMYIENVIIQWNKTVHREIRAGKDIYLNVLLYADYLAIPYRKMRETCN